MVVPSSLPIFLAAAGLTNQKTDLLRHPRRKPPKISLPPQLAPWGRSIKSALLLSLRAQRDNLAFNVISTAVERSYVSNYKLTSKHQDPSTAVGMTTSTNVRSTHNVLTYHPFTVCRALIPSRGNLPWTANWVEMSQDAINSQGANLNMLCMARRVNYRDVIHTKK